MTPYERGQRDMQRRAAEVCTTIATDGSLTPGKEALPAVYCAERILSLPIEGEADQRGAAVGSAKPVSAGSNASQEASVSPAAQSAPHPNPGDPVAWRYRFRDGGKWKVVRSEDECSTLPNYEREPLYAHPARSGPCVVVPVEPTEKMLAAANRAYGEYESTHMTRSNAWNQWRHIYAAMLAAAKEQHSQHLRNEGLRISAASVDAVDREEHDAHR